MPYIKPRLRRCLANIVDAMDKHVEGLSAGELNYLITTMLHKWLAVVNLDYGDVNEVIGVLECAKASLIETVLIPYEKDKMKQNGNVSELDKKYYEAL